MKKLAILAMILLLITGCGRAKETKNVIEINERIESMKVTINNKEYEMTLEDNETVTEFINKLPLELNMNELNGNEKYVYLDYSLKSNPTNPSHINKGDVMLYGDNCLVIFYKNFDTSYSYTKIGYIDNLPNLGSGSINVIIEK